MKKLTKTQSLTQLELVLLQLIQKGQGKWSWYELANALSRRDVPREPDMMEVLKKLEKEGLILREVKQNSPRDSYCLTDEGFRLLYNNKFLDYSMKITSDTDKHEHKRRKPKNSRRDITSYISLDNESFYKQGNLPFIIPSHFLPAKVKSKHISYIENVSHQNNSKIKASDTLKTYYNKI